MDYYSILGVTRTAENFVIKAAYKALMRAYHPDRVKGYEELVKKINEAFEVLSNPVKRAEYDEINSGSVDENAFEDKESSSDIDQDVNSDWLMIVEYYPELDIVRQDLRRYSSALSTSFILQILENKDFNNCKYIAQELKSKFLLDYFGSNVKIVALAEKLLMLKARAPLLEINRLMRILGGDINENRIITTLKKKYPEVEQIVGYQEKEDLVNSVKGLIYKTRKGAADFNDLTFLSGRLGVNATCKRGFFKDSWKVIDTEGKELKFDYPYHFEIYLLSIYDEIIGK